MTEAAATEPLETSVWSVRDLLTRTVSIPEYQRPYKWGVKNVDQLIKDVLRFKAYGRYRIGTVILHNTGISHDIVDGQQRFVSLVLLAQALGGHIDQDVREQLGAHAVPQDSQGITAGNISQNFQYIRGVVETLPPADRDELAQFVLNECEVVVLTLRHADEAFQMFDSQNTRGRALYPTDLLKAFHIREMSAEHVTPALRRRMVRLWEDIPAESVSELFSEYLFKIKRWGNGRHVPSGGFNDSHIDLFKGIRESDPGNSMNQWAMPFLYAKNFTDDYLQENATLIRYGALHAVEYPFQIDQPVINGETFFKMVDHYYNLGVACGLFNRGNATPKVLRDRTLSSAIAALDRFGDDRRYTYVRNLIDCLLLYYVDRFGTQHLDRAVPLIVRYGLALRFLPQVRRASVNNYALGRSPRGDLPAENLFSELREALHADDFVRRVVTVPALESRFRDDLEPFFAGTVEAWQT